MIQTDLPQLPVLDEDPVHRRATGRIAGKTGDAVTCTASCAGADTLAPEQSFECITGGAPIFAVEVDA